MVCKSIACRRPFAGVALISFSPCYYFVLLQFDAVGFKIKPSLLLRVRNWGKGGMKEMQCLSHQFISHYCVSVHLTYQQVSFKHLKQIACDTLPNPCHAVALVLFCVQYEVSLKSVHCKTKFTTTLI
jgi:hypothetical protein